MSKGFDLYLTSGFFLFIIGILVFFLAISLPGTSDRNFVDKVEASNMCTLHGLEVAPGTSYCLNNTTIRTCQANGTWAQTSCGTIGGVTRRCDMSQGGCYTPGCPPGCGNPPATTTTTADPRFTISTTRAQSTTTTWSPPPPNGNGTTTTPRRTTTTSRPAPSPRCGSHHGQTFPYTRTSWPSGSFCSRGSARPSSPGFPSLGGRTSWSCRNVDGVQVSCWARRNPPPPPTCGTNSMTFEATDTDWPEDGTFCGRGTSDPEASELEFPRAGETTNWTCSYFDEFNDPVDCEAKRLLPPSWISTRGGLFHVEGSSFLEMQSTLYSKFKPPGDSPPSRSRGYLPPLSIRGMSVMPMPGTDIELIDVGEKTSLSSELLTLTSDTLPSVGWKEKVYKLLNYSKRINVPWYGILLNRAQVRDPSGSLWSEVEGSNLDLNICKNNRHVYFVNGDLEVNPLDYEDLGLEGINGCIFVVKGNVTIDSGDYKSEGMDETDFYSAPGYDLVRGFFLVDGVIDIPFVDGDEDLRDGLKVVGGLFATGGDSSINLGRCLYIHNHKFPALIVFHDVRYSNLAREVFGNISYIRDIGFIE